MSILNYCYFGVVAFAIALSATSLGLIADSVGTGSSLSTTGCILFLKLDRTNNEGQIGNGKDSTCALSVSGSIISTACLAVVMVIEITKFVFGQNATLV